PHLRLVKTKRSLTRGEGALTLNPQKVRERHKPETAVAADGTAATGEDYLAARWREIS
ncbi:MAG: hypothetical protein QOH19_1807, partial [Actinomycetota bacterium]|nr:hypothetical protein [Actinomycetota bacterium]